MRELSERDRALNARARARAIGRGLRIRYQDTVEQPVPDDMIELLRKIDARQRQ